MDITARARESNGLRNLPMSRKFTHYCARLLLTPKAYFNTLKLKRRRKKAKLRSSLESVLSGNVMICVESAN